MAEFQNQHIRDKSLEELIDGLGRLEFGEVDSPVFEMTKAAIQVRLAERLAAPRRWAMFAAIAAVVSAAAVASAIAAF